MSTTPPASPAGEDAAKDAIERSNLYGFLAMIYRAEPTTAVVRELGKPGFRRALEQAGVSLDAGFAERPDDDLVRELAVEYTRLFVGPGKHIPPYEGVRTEGVLWGKSTTAVAKFIEGCGFAYKPEFHGLPDHIAVELEFMGEITRREAAAWESGDGVEAANCVRIEREFMAFHLSRWAPGFCDEVAERTTSPFYGEMAALTADFIYSEIEEIERLTASMEDADRHSVPRDTPCAAD